MTVPGGDAETACRQPFFAFMSMLIAVPAGVKFFNWIGTMWRGSLTFETPMLWSREALTMAARLHLDTPVVGAHELLIYPVLLRDQPAIADLVHTALTPTQQSQRRRRAPAGNP